MDNNNTACDQALNISLCWSDGGGVGLNTDEEGGSGGGGEGGGSGEGAGVEEGIGGGVGGSGKDDLLLSIPSDPHDDWRSIKEELQWAFPVHIYGFSCLFFMLAFYTFFSILNLRSQISSRPFMSTINVFLCVLGVTRAACFLIEPYTSGQVMPGFLGSFMWDVGFPCILSAFSLIQLAFSQLTQVKFRPEWLRRKSALSLLITSHFALVFGSDIATAFETHLQVVRWIVQSVFLSWGLVLCITFLYGGANIIRLLRTIPQNAFQEGPQNCAAENSKGILQLALLAQCNNIASSVLTTAATAGAATISPAPPLVSTVASTPSPQPMTPKIRITDEFDQTFSYGSDGAPRPSTSSSSALLLHPAESGSKSYDAANTNITEEDEVDVPNHSSLAGEPSAKTKGARKGSLCHENEQQKQGPKNHGQPLTSAAEVKNKGSPHGEVENYKGERKGSYTNHQIKKCTETKSGDIIIKVEEVDIPSDDQEHDEGKKQPVMDDVESKGQVSGKVGDASTPTEHKKKERVKEISKFKKYDSLKVKRGLYNIHPVKSLDSLLLADDGGGLSGKTDYGSGEVRRGSYTEGVTNKPSTKNKRKDSLQTTSFTKSHLKPDGEGAGVPKRKKSLTWSEDTQTIECHTKELISPSRKSSIHEDCDKMLKDNHRKASISSRRNSRTYGSEKYKVRNNRANEYSDLIVVGAGAGGRRRSSTVSSCSVRKGSDQWQTTLAFPMGKEQRSLSVTSATAVAACGSRRSSRKSLRDDAEVEALLDQSPCGQDVTLASILNHIAYVNQAVSVSKLPRPIKDSRKAQVQQVLIVTYVTAVLGTVLSLALVYRVYGYFSSSVSSATAAAAAAAVLPNPPWLWFTYESGCRFLEFLMGCAMANITRQPLNTVTTRRRHSQYHPNSLRLKQRNSIYNI